MGFNICDVEQLREKAIAGRLAKKEWAEENLRLEYADLPHWRDLASKYGLRLPSYVQPNTAHKFLKRAINTLGVDAKDYLTDCGVNTFKQLSDMNLGTTAQFEVGLFLEWYDEKQSTIT